MKNIITALAILFVGSFSSAATATLRPERALALLLKNPSALTLKADYDYEVSTKSVSDLLAQVLWTGYTSTITTHAECSLKNNEEVCYVYFNSETVDQENKEETSYILKFNVDRSSGQPAIKNKTVELIIAG